MVELKDYIYSLLKADATIQSLTGYTASDSRIYPAYPPKEVVVNSTYPGYIVFRLVGYGRGSEYVDRAEKGDMYLHLDIYGLTYRTAENIAVRVNDLLDLYGPFSTTNYRVLNLEVVEHSDFPPEGESTSEMRYRRHIVIRLRGVLSKTEVGNVA